MQPLRRWIPVPSRVLAEPAAPNASSRSAVLRLDRVAGQDLAFCAEFAAHGGIAHSADGFKGEADLIRMQQAGLLELERDPSPPFNIVAVSLSARARALPSQPGTAAPSAKSLLAPDSSPAHVGDRRQLRHGFEVARGLISAAVKTEIAAWRAAGGVGGAEALEARVMSRISQLPAPFAA